MYRYIAVATVVVLTACADATTAPKTPANVNTAGGASPVTVVPITELGAYVSVRVADTTGHTIFTEHPSVKFTAGPTDTLTVLDNSAKDLNPETGVVKAVIRKTGTYTACFVGAPRYSPDFPGTKWNSCNTVSSSALTVDAGKVYAQVKPQIVLVMRNQFGTLIKGGTYSFTDLAAGTTVSFMDNASLDENNTDGRIWYSIDSPRKMKVCQVLAPNGNVLTSDVCVTRDITKWAVGYLIYFDYETQVR